MRIVHFSDIHVAVVPRTLSVFRDKRILGMLNYLLRRRAHFHPEFLSRALVEIRRLQPNWVVFTGDLTCIGSPDEFARGCEQLARLRTAVGDRFIYVPGNHDAYVPRAGNRQALRDAFEQLNAGRWALDALPVEMAAQGIRFFLVNEAAPASAFLSTGRLDAATRDWLEPVWQRPREDGEQRVLVGHFPTQAADGRRLGRRRRLDGDEWLAEHLRSGRVDIALCGHIHRPFARSLPDGAREICAGSLTAFGKLSVLDYSYTDAKWAHFWVDVSEDGPQPVPLDGHLAPVVE